MAILDYVKTLFTKVVLFGGDGNIIDGTNPLPVTMDGDIQIGAVEIKDGITDTRASVGADGLQVEVKKSALPIGGATEAKQLPDNHSVTVSNPTADPETGLAKDTILTDGSQKSNPSNYANRIDKTSTANKIYIGDSIISGAEGSAVWRIQVIDKTSLANIKVLWADGDELFNNVWNNRTSLSYS